MPTNLKATRGRVVTINIPEPGKIESFFAFSLNKAGSVMFDGVIEDICRYCKIPAVSIPKVAFSQGIDEQELDNSTAAVMQATGYCYYGFRELPPYLFNFDFQTFKKLLLVRDPRDMLVSFYYSTRFSHTIPPGEAGDRIQQERAESEKITIDDYVIECAPKFIKAFKLYSGISDDNLRVFRYEDVVFNKQQWIKDICDYLDLELTEAQIKTIADKYNVFPDQENPQAHIRKVTPGDHQEKLQAETIAALNQAFAEFLDKFGY